MTTIRGRRTRLASFAVAALTGAYLFGSFADPALMQSGYPSLGVGIEFFAFVGAAAAVVAYLFLTGVSSIEIRENGIRVRTPLRSTMIPWDSLIRFHCDRAFAEMWLIYAQRDRRGRSRPAWACVNERQGRAILADARTEWIPVEGRFGARGPPA